MTIAMKMEYNESIKVKSMRIREVRHTKIPNNEYRSICSFYNHQTINIICKLTPRARSPSLPCCLFAPVRTI